jgi:hypothetical protein
MREVPVAAKVGGFLGVFAGWLVWQWVGGIGGLLLAAILVVPIASVVFIAMLSAVARPFAGEASPSSSETSGSEAVKTKD